MTAAATAGCGSKQQQSQQQSALFSANPCLHSYLDIVACLPLYHPPTHLPTYLPCQVGAIIVSPTRELAKQTHAVAAPFVASCPGLSSLLLVGGT